MKVLTAMLLSVIMLSSGFFVNSPAIAAPNDNANDNAKRTFTLPDNAIEIAPGIFHVSAIHEGKLVDGIIAYHHRPGHGGGSGGSTGGDPCFAVFAKGAKWKVQEDYIIDPSNVIGLPDQNVRDAINTAIATWEASTTGNIFGGEIAGTVNGIDEVAPDGKNEVLFGNVGGNGALGVTIVWGHFSGPPQVRDLIEWDQMYDDVDFTNWSIGSSTAVVGKYDFESVAAHEVGHAAGLSHPSDACIDETMYRFVSTNEIKKRDLNSGDIAGIQSLYG
jgi:hypothetical protein